MKISNVKVWKSGTGKVENKTDDTYNGTTPQSIVHDMRLREMLNSIGFQSLHSASIVCVCVCRIFDGKTTNAFVKPHAPTARGERANEWESQRYMRNNA